MIFEGPETLFGGCKKLFGASREVWEGCRRFWRGSGEVLGGPGDVREGEEPLPGYCQAPISGPLRGRKKEGREVQEVGEEGRRKVALTGNGLRTPLRQGAVADKPTIFPKTYTRHYYWCDNGDANNISFPKT